MSTEKELEGSLKQLVAKLFEIALTVTVPDEPDVEPVVAPCPPKFGDYQCNNAMGLWKKIKDKGTQFTGPQPLGKAIMSNLPQSEMIESCSIAGPGFVNVKLAKPWIAKRIHKMLTDGIETWSPKLNIKTAVVDFSSPNTAKEMHVGHLRSTIIGDTLARMLEFSNVKVLRRNHVGDWGTQFGMLIEYLFEKFPDWEAANDQAIGDLEAFYKASKERFDDDPGFKERAQQAVVSLQGGQEKYRKAWTRICETSRRNFQKVYHRLGVHLEEKGKDWSEEEVDKTAEAIGYGAVKYADLKNNRLTNYTFNYDQMLNDKGNTAVYLLYAHARICSIIRKSGRDIEELKQSGTLDLAHPDERVLGLHLLQFAEIVEEACTPIVEEACTNLFPNILCEYLYNLSEDFTRFYTNCQVVGSAEETSRLLLCEATAVVMRKCFDLLGITPVYKI
ncbi:hypothetical protein Leryth_012855 [Lithospermum erythrorhizon]|nr:hypothetical protein Leryth_012855 [Lithospermum erythrorhizon]